jgi:hypothetical protein
MTEFEVYKNFAVKNLTEEEVLNILPSPVDEAYEGSQEQKNIDRVYPLEPVYRKDAEKMIELRDLVEKKLGEKTFDEKDAIDLAEKVLFKETAIKIPKDERKDIYKEYKKYLKEKDEASKLRMAKRLAFILLKLIDKYRAEFDKAKKVKISIDQDGNKSVVPTKGKNDQIPIKRDILQNSITPLMKQIEKKIDDIKKILSDLDFANSHPLVQIYTKVVKKPFASLDDVGKYLSRIFSGKYLDEFFENNTKKYEETYRNAISSIKNSKSKGKEPDESLTTDEWTALLLKKLRDFRDGAIILKPEQVSDIIVAIEKSNLDGLKTAGKFILTGLNSLLSHGREAPISK